MGARPIAAARIDVPAGGEERRAPKYKQMFVVGVRGHRYTAGVPGASGTWLRATRSRPAFRPPCSSPIDARGAYLCTSHKKNSANFALTEFAEVRSKAELLLYHRLCWLRASYGVRMPVHDLTGAILWSKDHR